MANVTATERRSSLLQAVGQGPAYSVKNLSATIELAATTSGDTITFGRVPSNARFTGQCRLYNDDIATSGSPTIQFGLRAVDGNLVNADDPDAIGTGFALSSSGSDVLMFSDIANIGLPAWDLVASESSDPGGVLEVYGTIKAAPTFATGTITVDINYVID